MREAAQGDVLVARGGDMAAAMERVFGPAALDKVHGPGRYEVTPWVNGSRHINVSVDVVGSIPPAARRFICGEVLRATIRQNARQSREGSLRCTDITCAVRMHFVGAELFKVRPSFHLRTDDADPDGRVWLSARVEHHAVLPRPFNRILEDFMAAQSAAQLYALRSVITSEQH